MIDTAEQVVNNSVAAASPKEKTTPTQSVESPTSALETPASASNTFKVNTGSTKKSSIKIPNIADIKSGNFELKKEEQKQEKELPKKEFSYGDFKHYWDEAIAIIASKKQTSTNVMIANLNPDLKNDTEIHLVFNNKIQQELFNTERSFLAGHLREKLENFDIDFVIELNSIELDSTPYTNSDKFKSMAAKNPNLQVLRDVLGLDVS